MGRGLSGAGRGDVLLAMMLRKDAPSYGSQLAAGATALTEAWDSKTGSQDHFMLGAGNEWFYRGLLGIDVDRSRSEALIVKPQIVEGVDWVKGSYESSLGMVGVEWKRRPGGVEVMVTSPGETRVLLPGAVILGKSAREVDGGWVVGKGVWSFRVKG